MPNYLIRSFADIFKEIDPSTMRIKNKVEIPNDFYRQLLDYVLERGYLNELSDRSRFLDFAGQPGETMRRITWMRVDRLPIHPNEMKEYDLLSRWQGVLSTLHTWGHRLVFMLQRKHGETGLYLGTASLSRDVSAAQAIEQFKEAATSSMPGIDLKPLTTAEELQAFTGNLVEYNTIGAVTGIPSFKKDSQFGMLQTLDQLAFGIRDGKGVDSDFSLMVIADPLSDMVMSETITKFRRLGSEIHLDVRRTVSESENVGQNKSHQLGIGSVIGGLLGSCIGFGGIGAGIGGMFDMGTAKTYNTGQSINTDYLDKFAEYAEEVVEMHCERLK
ncbi:MAG: hypothetical protein FWD43_06280, partial [Coriobacteriia bacterium]|nr:hypothetical protein [Coriobacteriia bacterium]